MPALRSLFTALALGTVLALTAQAVVEAIDVKVAHEKTFDFKAARTWGWNPKDAGHVRMVRTKDDDSEAMKKRVDPLIREAVAAQMAKKGLTEAKSNPDLTVTYYLLLTVNVETQQFGQFLPTAVIWEVPLYATGTQSMKVFNKGSLVLDFAAKSNTPDSIVWRGVAEAQVEPDAPSKKREDKIRDAVRDLFKKYPPK